VSRAKQVWAVCFLSMNIYFGIWSDGFDNWSECPTLLPSPPPPLLQNQLLRHKIRHHNRSEEVMIEIEEFFGQCYWRSR